MKENEVKVDGQPEGKQPPKKTFHGFSMGFLLTLLAIVVGLYIVCAVLAG